LSISLRPAHLRRYAEIARLFWKYVRPEIKRATELVLPNDVAEPSEPTRGDLAGDLERMGPTFVKLGQVLSTRPDLLPPGQLEALSRLQDRCQPFPFEEARAVVEQELGARLGKIFSHFEREPIAAASLGQVHRATLRDGRAVAVKVQRPDIRERAREDLEMLASAAEFLDRHADLAAAYRFVDLIAEFRRALALELDYTAEAANLTELAEILRPFPLLRVPEPFGGLSSSRVLTMEFIHGRKITEVGPLALIDVDGRALADQLFAAYLEQILVAGLFHADPHPGNVFLTDDGTQLALLDVGMVGKLGPETQDKLLRILLAASDGRGEELADLAEAMGDTLPGYDPAALRHTLVSLLVDHREARVADIAVGRLMIEVNRAASAAGLRLPAELALLGKTLAQLDEIGRALAPDFDPNRAIRQHAAELSRKRMRSRTSLRRVLAASYDMAEFVEKLPGRANRILDRVAANGLSLRIEAEAFDQAMLLQGAQTIANRIVLGLVLAALIVGAALLMRVETSFRLLGYPGLAILCFLAATAGGVALVLQIAFADVRRKPEKKTRV